MSFYCFIFGWEGSPTKIEYSPTKIEYRKKLIQLILTSLLEDLEVLGRLISEADLHGAFPCHPQYEHARLVSLLEMPLDPDCVNENAHLQPKRSDPFSNHSTCLRICFISPCWF